MRMLVVSDTHGDYRNLAAILRLLGRSVQALIHLGDGSGDVRSASRSGVPMPPVFGLRGNMDSDTRIPLQTLFNADGRMVLAAHGHRFPLSSGLSCLSDAARQAGARAFFFGHTHVPLHEERGGVIIMNPGSLARPRGPWGPSFAVVEAPASMTCLEVKIYELMGTLSKPRFKAIRL
jgi:uncharacterized protein